MNKAKIDMALSRRVQLNVKVRRTRQMSKTSTSPPRDGTSRPPTP
jgi:hypothetical protein